MISVRNQNRSVVIELGGCEVELTTDELENFIRDLAAARSTMEPPPADLPMATLPVTDGEPTIAVDADESTGELTLMLRSPGLGWLAARLSEQRVRALQLVFDEHLRAVLRRHSQAR